ncbi:hypothetical protein [Deinococcus altitudinis]|uniref:hypothetical protein n=1 Tax=Deinococcus altitudinis TaxID=468914 RepID=UPI003891F688
MLRPGSTAAQDVRIEAVFAAAATEDRIRGHLLNADAPGRQEILNVLLPRLFQLNREQFGDSAGIAATLAALEGAVRAADAAAAWEAFLALAERPGPNFGTWAI